MFSTYRNTVHLVRRAGTIGIRATKPAFTIGTPSRASFSQTTATRSNDSPAEDYQKVLAPDVIRKKLKWGFNIYRCDYQNDDAWRAFMQIWSEEVTAGVRSLYADGDRIAGALDMCAFSDRKALEGATVEQVQAMHATHTKEQARLGRDIYHSDYCVHIDTDALYSCLRVLQLPEEQQFQFGMTKRYPRDPALGKSPYVNVIRPPNPLHDGEDAAKNANLPVSIKVYLWTVLPSMYENINKDWFYRSAMEDSTHDQDGVVVQ
ncbi:hypothetical protein E8E13_003004 [Curvularia kusanoi]|uniref:Uncharacterized protein n=1 Tax=Curvularia kusanoi TaxID=90978 RepID=A0A9P4T8H9_CURKU|nr:hypothetical protein E8E13_003004 [Curvularia kusanoi]